MCWKYQLCLVITGHIRGSILLLLHGSLANFRIASAPILMRVPANLYSIKTTKTNRLCHVMRARPAAMLASNKSQNSLVGSLRTEVSAIIHGPHCSQLDRERSGYYPQSDLMRCHLLAAFPRCSCSKKKMNEYDLLCHQSSIKWVCVPSHPENQSFC